MPFGNLKFCGREKTEDEKGKKEMEKNYIKFHNDNNIMRQLWNFISDSNEQLWKEHRTTVSLDTVDAIEYTRYRCRVNQKLRALFHFPFMISSS